MNDERDLPIQPSRAAGDRIGRLLRLAGPRPEAPRERAERVRDSVRARWRASVRARRRRRRLIGGGAGLAAAASLLLLFGVQDRGTIELPEPAFEGPIGYLQAVSGTVLRLDAAGVHEALRLGDPIAAGETIDTGVLGRAALQLASGASLRLDRGTRLRGVTDAVVILDQGAVYLDSGGAGVSDPVEIRTPFGTVYDIGTQFEVRLDDAELRVRVREGAVHVDRDGTLYDAGAGVELTVDASGAPSRRSVPAFGPEWDWVLSVAPPFELEGSTLDRFLGWVTRETGLETHFVDPEASAGASRVVLHGSIEGIQPDQALEAVLPTCGLVHRLDGGMVVIQAEGP